MRRWSYGLGAVVLVLSALVSACTSRAAPEAASALSFTAHSGPYSIQFTRKAGAISIRGAGQKASFDLREPSSSKGLNLLPYVSKVRHQGSRYLLSGKAPWASFTLTLTLPNVPGLLHVRLTVNPRRGAPQPRQLRPDMQLAGAPSSSLTLYAPAPPIAGTSLLLSAPAAGASVLYLADLTALGPYFDRTQSGPTQSAFSYPRAGTKGALVGNAGDGYFGYIQPPLSMSNLPKGKSTVVTDSLIYLVPQIPSGEAGAADTYLKMLDAAFAAASHPAVPSADWRALAAQQTTNLADSANWVTVSGHQFLRSYVSDTRSAPELITQAGVLAGVLAYEAQTHQSVPFAATLEAGLPSFYDSTYHSVTNGIGHDPSATGESWYFAQNMISLLQAAQLGSDTARTLLLNSADAFIALAHTNGYEFPQTFRYSDWNGAGSGTQPDVAGGYAWVMLGLYDLTKDARYLDEAKTAVQHVLGKGFDLSYETQMTAYTAAAAQRLYKLSGDAKDHDAAVLALANLFHNTRLWDCTFGLCRKGTGYHTYFGLNPLPWSDYTAMLEQYEAWLGLRDYLQDSGGEPSYALDLVHAFLDQSPRTMQYALPTRLPAGVATANPSEYSFVAKNQLQWSIPLEDLREGETNSGVIGQEIYGAGGPYMFAAYAQG